MRSLSCSTEPPIRGRAAWGVALRGAARWGVALRGAALCVAALAIAGCGTGAPAGAGRSRHSRAEVRAGAEGVGAAVPAGALASTEQRRAEVLFEGVFQREYERGARAGFLRAGTVRFRTPCRAEASDLWKCEGWGVRAHTGGALCFVATATVGGGQVEGVHTETHSPRTEALVDACRAGAGEGRAPGDLRPEGP